MTANMIGVRFREASKIYHFAPPQDPVREGEYVVVETARGLEMARVVTVPPEDAGPVPQDARPIVRLADGADRSRTEEMRDLGERMLERTRSLIVARGLPMYIVAVQVNLAGTEATCHFQADGHVDFMPAVNEVESEFDVRIHMQQAGPRDRAKIVDGYDICGLRLCCSSWMTNFPKVGIRMAKEQSLALNPDKISGVCGRLLCCLTFEYDAYREMRGSLPKVGKRVSTPAGMGRVWQTNVLKQTIVLELDDHPGRIEVPAVEIGMAVRVEDAPNAALEETLDDVLGRPARPAERSPDEPRRRRRRGRGRGEEGRAPRSVDADAAAAQTPDQVKTPDGESGGEGRPGRRRRRRGRGDGREGRRPGAEAESRGAESPAPPEGVGRDDRAPAADAATPEGATPEGSTPEAGRSDGVSSDGVSSDGAPRRRRRRRRGRGGRSAEAQPGETGSGGDTDSGAGPVEPRDR